MLPSSALFIVDSQPFQMNCTEIFLAYAWWSGFTQKRVDEGKYFSNAKKTQIFLTIFY
jgi:hypothetical protein